MEYGERVIRRGLDGPDVVELQIRLAGFRGTVPDGDFGPGTELQVMTFQRDYMRMPTPDGIVNRSTMEAIDDFADRFPFDLNKIKCPCGGCGGFGNGRFKNQYRAGKPQLEMYYRYEYPGMHRMLLWATRAVFFYMPQYTFSINSGYRCSIDNQNHGRSSTNHHGKAIDIDVVSASADDAATCNKIRGKIVETANAQISWLASNRKSLEPESLAATWVHYDVRSYEKKYLTENFLCTSLDGLNNKKPIKI